MSQSPGKFLLTGATGYVGGRLPRALGDQNAIWFRGKDLRVSHHAPLRSAASSGDVLPLFVLDPHFFAKNRAQEISHRMQFLLESLVALEGNLNTRGLHLVVVEGKSADLVPSLVEPWKTDRVLAHSWVAPVQPLWPRSSDTSVCRPSL